jgi:maltose/moltooligosaccharide transporter
VVKNALCDVLVVQTSALDEERLFGAPAAGAATNGTGAATNGTGSGATAHSAPG